MSKVTKNQRTVLCALMLGHHRAWVSLPQLSTRTNITRGRLTKCVSELAGEECVEIKDDDFAIESKGDEVFCRLTKEGRNLARTLS